MRLVLVSLAALAAAPVALATAAYVAGGPAAVRSIFLNGIDVSSARNQDLKNVDVVINEHGDVFIAAPHYQVNEEDTYLPLSKYVQSLNAPAHKPMQKAGEAGKVGPTEALKHESPKAVPPPPGAVPPKASDEDEPKKDDGMPPAAQPNVQNGEPALSDKPGVKMTNGSAP